MHKYSENGQGYPESFNIISVFFCTFKIVLLGGIGIIFIFKTAIVMMLPVMR